MGASLTWLLPAGEVWCAVFAGKAICAGCPVRRSCLADVLGWENPSRRHGIVGGLTPNGRTRLVAAQRRTRGREVAA